MRNFSDAEIGITRGDLRRILEWWYNKEQCSNYQENEKRRVEVTRISTDAKYVVRINVLSPSIKAVREQKGEAA